MNKIIFCIVLFFSCQCFSDVITWYDLELRGELFYVKSKNIPFTGKITGREEGNIIEGKKEGLWREFWDMINLVS